MGVERRGYIEPGVRVYQIIEGINEPLSDVPLNPILVGACYKVVNREPLEMDGNDFSSSFVFALPLLPPGAIVNEDGVTLFVSGRAVVMANVPVTIEAGVPVVIPEAMFNVLRRNDVIKFVGPAGTHSKTALYKCNYTNSYKDAGGDDVYEAYLTDESGDNIPISSDGDYVLTVYRDYVDHKVKSGFSVGNDIVTVNSLMAQNVFNFISGSISVSYTALRRDIVGRHKIRTLKDLRELMETDIENPLGFFAAQSINAGSTNGVAGSTLYLHVTQDDDIESVQAAVEDLSDFGIYYLVPIVGGKDTANAYMQFVTTRTQPEIGEFMMTMVSPADGVITQEAIASLTA